MNGDIAFVAVLVPIGTILAVAVIVNNLDRDAGRNIFDVLHHSPLEY